MKKEKKRGKKNWTQKLQPCSTQDNLKGGKDVECSALPVLFRRQNLQGISII